MRFILTSNGFKELPATTPLPDPQTAQEGGKTVFWVWDLITEQIPDPWEQFKGWTAGVKADLNDMIKDGMIKAAHALVDISGEIAMVAAMVFLLIAMFGSARATKWLYWTFAGYIIVNILGAALP